MKLLLAMALLMMHIQLNAFQCLEVFKDSKLTESQFFWLKMAQQTDYEVRTLKSQKGQTVVILGESHLKNLGASIIGKRLLLEFSYRAHEYASTEKTWGGDLFASYLEAVFKEIRTTTDRTQGSTISDAFVPKEQMLSSLNDMIKMVEKLPDIKYEASENSKARLQEFEYKNFFLENNHKPDLKENLYSVIVPGEMISKVMLAPTALASWAYPQSFVAEIVLPSLVAVIGVRALQKYLGQKLEPKYGERKWFNSIFFDKMALLDARNQTKANNIVSLLNKHPEIQTLLVIVGQLHVEGIEKNLMKKGFQNK